MKRILYSADAEAGGGMAAPVIPSPAEVAEDLFKVNLAGVDDTAVNTDEGFLDEDMSQVDTSMPLVKEGPCELLLAKLEKVPTKKGDGFCLKFTLKATQDMETTKDDVVHEGFPFFKQISITPTPDYTEDMIKKNVALFVQCAGGTKLFPLAQYEGMVLKCRVTIRKARKDPKTGQEYDAQNEVKFVKE